MKMTGKDVATFVIVLGIGGYSYYGSETGKGPIGWLNYAQQAIFGTYDGKFSFILALVLAGVLFVLVEFAWKKVSGSPDGDGQSIGSRILFGAKTTSSTPSVSKNPATTSASQSRVLLQSAIIVIIATWTIGFAIYWWYAAEQREDASAQYEPIDLSDGGPLRQPRGSHIALRGGVPLDAALVHETTSLGSSREDYRLVPIVSRGWVKGQSVAFVVKIKDRSELQDPIPTKPLPLPPSFYKRPPLPAGVSYADPPRSGASEVQDPIPTRPSAQGKPAASGVFMARIDGPVPGPVALEFKKIGVPLSELTYLLRLVKTRDGKAITGSIEDAFLFFLGFCALISAAICALMGGVWLMRARAGRKGLS